MEKNLTEAQVTTILKNAPKGTDPNKIVDGLVSRGYILQGFNDQPVVAEKPKSSATFQATGNEGIVGGTLKAVGNVPKSAVNLGSNVISAVANPIETVSNIGKTVVGGGEALGRAVGIASSDVKRPEEQQFNNVVDFFKNRYGSIDQLKKTAIEDPVGFAADLSAVFTGGGSALAKVGEISKVSTISDIANTLTKAGQATEPINAISKVKNTVKNSTVGNIVSDISPTSYKVQQGQVVKALELTPGDLSTIQKSTGNDVTKFIVDNNLIKGTPEETAHALNDMRQLTMQQVRGEVARVKTVYNSTDIPSVKNGLNVILSGIDKVPGLESVALEVKALANKGTYTLEDIQKAKELLDQNSNIYSKVGDVKSTSQAKGLANIRSELKTFIENEVSKNTNGETNIQKLNNDVATSYAVEDAITNRVMKGMSRQYLSAYDLALGMGGAYFNPLLGAGIVIGKKIAQSPAFRLKVAKILSKQPLQFVKDFAKEMAKNNLSESTRIKMQSIVDQAQKNLPYIESGSNALQTEQEVQ